MNITQRLSLLLGVGFLASAIALAHQMPEPTAKSKEFESLKPLVGSWKGMSTHPDSKTEPAEPVAVSFKMTAAGSAIEETLMQGTPHEMVDMYHDEGGKLAMTHYCALGNQPHMILKKADAGMVSFEMGPTPGIDAAKDLHMHALTLKFPDANHLTEEWTSYANGKAGEKVIMTMTRS
jgi:hypothetical protein